MNKETMNLVVLLLLILHLFSVSCVDAGKVVVFMDSNITHSFDDKEADSTPPVKATVETGVLHVAEPLDACQNLRNKPKQGSNDTSHHFVLIVRGGCTFEYKIRNAQRSGFKAAIIHDNVYRNTLFAMEGDPDGIRIQAVFVTKATGETLKKYIGMMKTEVMFVSSEDDSVWWSLVTKAFMVSLDIFAVLVVCVFVYRRCTTHSNVTYQFYGMSRRMVKALPSVTFTCVHGDNTTASTCAICLEDYIVGDKLRVLPCDHKFHAACVDSWLTSWRTFCPVCKRDARTSTDEPQASETTPLLRSSITSSSIVLIDSPSVGSSHRSLSHFQQPFRSSTHHSLSSPINVNHMSADLRQQAFSLQSSSQRSYITYMDSLHSPSYWTMSPLNVISTPPYRSSLSNASPGLVQSTNHRFSSLLCCESASSLSPFTSAHSLRDC